MRIPSSKYIEAFHKLVLAGDYNRAIEIELDFYNKHVKKEESLAAWEVWVEGTLAIKKALTEQVTALSFFGVKEKSKPSQNLLIIYHNFSGLAHETQLARKISALRKRGATIHFRLAYLFGDPGPKRRSAEIWGCEESSVHFLQSNSYTNAFLKLRALVGFFNPSVIIYPSVFFLAFWSSIFTPHRNQKFLIMKYDPPRIGNFSAFGGGGDQCLRNEAIRTIFLPVEHFPVTARKMVSSDSFVRFGSISRVEKQLAPEYNDFILRLIEAKPHLLYLYTCREEELERIPQVIRRHPRATWLGWVEPERAIENYDIYVDPFPWGGGDMSFLAISRGIPYLALETPESKRMGVLPIIRNLAETAGIASEVIFKDVGALSCAVERLASCSATRIKFGALLAAATVQRDHDGDNAWLDFLTHEKYESSN